MAGIIKRVNLDLSMFAIKMALVPVGRVAHSSRYFAGWIVLNFPKDLFRKEHKLFHIDLIML